MKYYNLITIVLIAVFLVFLHAGCQEPVADRTIPEKIAQTPQQASEPAEIEEDKLWPEDAVPELTFEKTVHNFGEVAPDKEYSVDFKFTNTGNATLKIGDIGSACDCTTTELEKKEYEPGEGGVITVKYHSSQKLGEVSRVLYVPYNSKKKEDIRLAVVADVTAPIDYEPKELRLAVKEGKVISPDIVITGSDNRPFAITSFESPDNCITAEFDPAVEKTEFAVKPDFKISTLQNNLKGDITIKLTHPDYNTVQISYSALPRFKLSPTSIVLFGGKPDKPIIRQVWLRNNYHERFQVESVTSEGKMAKVLNHKWISGRYWIGVQLIAPEIQEGQKEFEEIVYIRLKDGTELELPCKWKFPKTAQPSPQAHKH
jgi:hypothetical protein